MEAYHCQYCYGTGFVTLDSGIRLPCAPCYAWLEQYVIPKIRRTTAIADHQDEHFDEDDKLWPFT